MRCRPAHRTGQQSGAHRAGIQPGNGPRDGALSLRSAAPMCCGRPVPWRAHARALGISRHCSVEICSRGVGAGATGSGPCSGPARVSVPRASCKASTHLLRPPPAGESAAPGPICTGMICTDVGLLGIHLVYSADSTPSKKTFLMAGTVLYYCTTKAFIILSIRFALFEARRRLDQS